MKVRQPYREPVVVPALDGRAVNPGQVVDIPAGTLPNFLSAGWKPADTEAKTAAAKLTAPATDAPAAQDQEG